MKKLECYEKNNQGAQEFAQKSAKRAHPSVPPLEHNLANIDNTYISSRT